MLYLVALLGAVATASAWWCTGHMLVANVAMQSMTKTSITRANELIAVLDDWYPRTPDFRQAACWADDLKTEDVSAYDDWHFLNLPYVTGPIQFALEEVSESNNVPWAVLNALTVLKSEWSSTLDKAIQLRFLIHFVGDMHQPLHIINGISNTFPAPVGDMGGNLYIIHGVNISDLHGFYDSGAEQWFTDLKRPLAPANASLIENIATSLVKEFPISNFAANLTVSDPWDWTTAIYTQFVNFVYSIPNNGTVTPAYEATAQVLCRSQVSLAGYRLATLLNAVFDPATGEYPSLTLRLRGAHASSKA